MILLILLTLLACAPPDTEECAFTVSTAYTWVADGVYEGVPCVTRMPTGEYDFTLCCPEPFEVIGVTSPDEVTCG